MALAVGFLPLVCSASPSAVDKALNEVEAAPNPYEMYVSKGDGFFAQKDYEQALINYKRAIDLQTGTGSIYQKMGDCSAALGRYHEALVFAQRAVEVDPKNLKMHLDLAMSYAAVKRFDEAKDELAKARKMAALKEEIADVDYVAQALNEMVKAQ